MSLFTGPLAIEEAHVDSDYWRLLTPLAYEIGAVGSGVFVTAETGFVSDGASIPWPINIIFPRWGRRYRRPAVIHDKCCRMINQGTPLAECPTRTKADRIFLEAMTVCGVSAPVRYAFYLAVRIVSIIKGL